MKYNTRIAPSPTGDMHLGTCRTAYFNWLAARASGGSFLLRIDDTDKKRSKKKYVKSILATMKWLGLDYDNIVYQSDRFDRYRGLANALVQIGDATVLDNGAIAFNRPKEFVKKWKDNVAGWVKISDVDKDHVDGLILIKEDGSPTYNWASIIDDQDYQINYIIRGNDHLSNTTKQLLVYNSMGHHLPEFAHVGLIHYQKKKLSKRKQEVGDAPGAGSMLYYRDRGYDPDAVLNFMLRLGWGPRKDDKTTKTIDRDRALELFLDGGKMRAAPSNMDLNMLEAFDRKYKAQKGVWRNKDKLVNE